VSTNDTDDVLPIYEQQCEHVHDTYADPLYCLFADKRVLVPVISDDGPIAHIMRCVARVPARECDAIVRLYRTLADTEVERDWLCSKHCVGDHEYALLVKKQEVTPAPRGK
jgi:hypothetical protein